MPAKPAPRAKTSTKPRSRPRKVAASSFAGWDDQATQPAAPDWSDLRAPSGWLLALESRAPLEYLALMAALPWMRQLPQGDGHPVMIFPGLGANDTSTAPLRALLDSLGYHTHPWGQGFNFGPRTGVLERCEHDLRRLRQRFGRKPSLVGWSLGGLYARELAKACPDEVRSVVTLGTPFAGHPRATHAWRFFELVSGQNSHDPALLDQLRQPPPVPTTSIYSRSDGIVAWHCSVNEPGPLVENIEVHASHIGLGFNPMALYALADRLAQAEGHWQPFKPHGARKWFYRTPSSAAD
ncbi:lipase family alpha/beta hydrolase [Roseateles sp.]|uniref:lipase family alpha/beta hydrolase n=1 Tax=Roseateles sp. TaxID=1971397 RepID=UPI00395227F3